MRFIPFLLAVMLAATALPLAAADDLPVGIAFNDRHVPFGYDCTGIYVAGDQRQCIATGAYGQGATASFGIGAGDAPLPVLASGLDGKFRVSALIRADAIGIGHASDYEPTTGGMLLLFDLMGKPIETDVQVVEEGPRTVFTFTIDSIADSGAGVAIATLAIEHGAAASPMPFSIVSDLAFLAGQFGASDLIQANTPGQPLLLIKNPALPDADGDLILDAVDNCPTAPNQDQADADMDRVGDACDDDPNDGPLGDIDGDNFPNAVEEAAGTDPADADDNPAAAAMAAVGTVQAAADDLQAFAAGADDYCAEDGRDTDPKCIVYKQGADTAGIVTAVAADIQSFANSPAAYCQAKQDDPKCQAYAAPSALDPDGDGVAGTAATKQVIRDPDGNHVRTIGDNCPVVANKDQADMDLDGEGDACDDDIDGDGVKNSDEDLNDDGIVQPGESDPRDKKSTKDDRDGDGHLNSVEVAAGSNPDDKKSVPDDIDGDGVANRDDKCPGYDDKVDTDGDGIPDGCDADAADGPAGDSDGDGVKNADDPFPNDPLRSLDADKDGVAEDGPAATRDNCPTIANPDQTNTDLNFVATATMPAGDGLGDACDDDDDADGVTDVDEVAAGSDPLNRASNPKDLDGDGISNESGTTPFDNCPTVANPAQVNTDRDFVAVNGMPAGDGLGDACDDDDDADGYTDAAEISAGSDPLNRASIPSDLDGDGVPNSSDLCPGHDDALDADKDGIPDGCDADAKDGPNGDSDGDGVVNSKDAFPNDPLRSSDIDGDGVADDGPEPRDNCPNFVNPNQKDVDGDGIGDACDPDNTDGPKGDKDGDGFSNKVEADAGSDPADPKSVPTDWDGDGWSNAAELDAGTDPRNAASKPAGTAPSELEKQAQLKELSRKVGATLTGKTTFGANETILVTLKFTAPDGAAGLQVLRSNSPYQVLASLPATATSYTDTNSSLNAKYMVVAFASGGVGKVLENASKELAYLPALENDGLYFKVVKSVNNDGTATFQNGNTQSKQVNVTVEVYDKDGKLIRVENKAVMVPAHGTTPFSVNDVNTKGGSSYQVFVDGDDGQRTVLATGVITEGPQVDANILWLIAGSILLIGILILMVAGIVAYAKQPEESETA